jgi:tRNA(fMet)-specific endonuclease VapC
LLDSSILVALFRDDPTMRDRVARETDLFIAATTIGELLYGAMRSMKPSESEERLWRFAAGCTILPTDEETARPYARVKAALAAKGRPIPENDIWIAAVAMQYGLILAARDEHFTWIDGLDLERW